LPGQAVVRWFVFDGSWFLRGLVYQPLTYMFLHGGLLHLFLNMLWLFVFGPDVERTLGSRPFLRFYLLCGGLGVMATLVSSAMAVYLPVPWSATNSVAGASGAVMGVLVAFAMIDPYRELYLFPLPFRIYAVWLVVIVIALNLLSALDGRGGGASVATHFGGMIVGFAYLKFRDYMQNCSGKRHKSDMDKLGEAINNIFKFDDEKRRRR